MSYTGLTTLAMYQAELDVKLAERTTLATAIGSATNADILNYLNIQKSLVDTRIKELITLTGTTDFSQIVNPTLTNPLCIFGVKERYKSGGSYTFTSQWGDSRNEQYVSNTILSMVGSNLDYLGTSFPFAQKGIEKPFGQYKLPFSDEYTLTNEHIYFYSDNSYYTYSPILCGVLPLRNTTQADIDITVQLYVSAYSTSTSGGLFYYTPDVVNSQRTNTAAVTWNSASTTTSSGDRVSISATITVPADTSIMVVGLGHDRYYTTQIVHRSFGWGNIADIYPAGIVTDEDLAKCLLNENRTVSGRFDTLVDIFKTVGA